MTSVREAHDPTAAVLECARALAGAIGESAPYQAYKTAQEALTSNGELSARLAAFQKKAQEVQLAQKWGGADPEDERALEHEWRELSRHPTVAAHLAARAPLLRLLQSVSEAISAGAGLDFGDACRPAGGCC
jgi:cell fate (sporulation/competence/biofilm development) regulator YlbF (YheA/YmcA/DUF963 family)